MKTCCDGGADLGFLPALSGLHLRTGRLPRSAELVARPSRLGAAFLITVPVAYHCLWALGQDYSTRVLIH